MSKELVSRATLARMAGINPSIVTRACAGVLSGALDGKRVDLNHASVKEWLEEKTAPRPQEAATGIDPFYEQALAACVTAGKVSPRVIRNALNIGNARAQKIIATMKGAGVVIGEVEPLKDKPKAKPGAARKRPGNSAVNAKKEKEALAKLEPEDPPDPGDPSTLINIPEDVSIFLDWKLRDVVERFGTSEAFFNYLKATKEIEIINEKRIKNAEKRGELVSRDMMKRGVIEPIDNAHRLLLSDAPKTISVRVRNMVEAGDVTNEEIEKFVAEQLSSFIRPIKARVKRAMKGPKKGA